MIRKEEIEQQASLTVFPWDDVREQSKFEEDFIEGAKWADKTMIEKARQWFNLHFRQVGTPKEIKHDFQSKEKMWKSFTQFMEE
jgi:hypothetical protein